MQTCASSTLGERSCAVLCLPVYRSYTIKNITNGQWSCTHLSHNDRRVLHSRDSDIQGVRVRDPPNLAGPRCKKHRRNVRENENVNLWLYRARHADFIGDVSKRKLPCTCALSIHWAHRQHNIHAPNISTGLESDHDVKRCENSYKQASS